MAVPVSSVLTANPPNNTFSKELQNKDLKSLYSSDAIYSKIFTKTFFKAFDNSFQNYLFKKYFANKDILRIFVAYWLKSCFNSANIYINSAKRLFICNIKTIYQCLSLSPYFYREVVSVWK